MSRGFLYFLFSCCFFCTLSFFFSIFSFALFGTLGAYVLRSPYCNSFFCFCSFVCDFYIFAMLQFKIEYYAVVVWMSIAMDWLVFMSTQFSLDFFFTISVFFFGVFASCSYGLILYTYIHTYALLYVWSIELFERLIWISISFVFLLLLVFFIFCFCGHTKSNIPCCCCRREKELGVLDQEWQIVFFIFYIEFSSS